MGLSGAGGLAGVLAWVFIVTIHRCKNWVVRIPGNRYVQHAVPMLWVGIMIYVGFLWTGRYDAEGVGYATVGDLLRGADLSGGLLLALFAAKFLATVLTLGTGGSGGIFSPALFLGASQGALAAALLSSIGVPAQPVLWALGGMAGMVAATSGAVLGSSVMIIEMTGQAGMALAVLLASITAYAVRRLFLQQSGYTRSLADGPQAVPENRYAQIWLGRRRR